MTPYERARNKLIPTAAKYADDRLKAVLADSTDTESRDKFWNKCFCNKMDDLAYEVGLVKWRVKKCVKS